MISCNVLEEPGKWRLFGIASALLLALLPALILVGSLGLSPSSPTLWYDFGFGLSIIRSLLVAGAVGLATLLIGLPFGILGGLYEFSARRWLLAMLALPLLVPSFFCGQLVFRCFALSWDFRRIVSSRDFQEPLSCSQSLAFHWLSLLP